jgi:hypothetical protein
MLQLWIWYTLEGPFRANPVANELKDQFNWTSNYRWDSDVPLPYEHWEMFDKNIKRQPPGSPAAAINYAANKTKKVGEILKKFAKQ